MFPWLDRSSADGEKAAALPLLGRKSVLVGLLASGFVAANAAQPSAVAATGPGYAVTWTPYTAYALGQQVVSPNNDVVSAKVAHTSSATYVTDTARWAVSLTYARTPGTGKNSLTGWFHADGYGAKGDGVTDDTAALQRLFDAAQTNTNSGVAGGTVYLPSGEYVISDTISTYRWSGLVMGAGLGNSPKYAINPGNATVVRWNGPSTKPMFLLHDYQDVKFSNLRLEGNDTSRPTYGIESRNTVATDGMGCGAALVLSNVKIGNFDWSSQGPGKGLMQCGVGFTGANGNNDQFSIRDTAISGCAVGIDLPNSQSIWGTLDNVFIAAATTAGIRTCATLNAVNLTFDYCAVDIVVASTNNVNVLGWYSERSGKIFDITGSGGSLSVTGGLWTIGSRMQGLAYFAQAAALNGPLHLQSVKVVYQISPKPPLRVRGTYAPVPYTISIKGCTGLETLALLDIQGYGAPGVTFVDIDTQGIRINRNIITGALVERTTVAALGVGNSKAATSPGAVVKKIEVFDTAGASLGFIPVYSAIS